MSDDDEDIAAAKKGCTGCLGCLGMIVVVPWLIFGPIYYFFAKNAEEAVRDVSIQDVLYTGWLLEGDSSAKQKKAIVENLVSEIKRESGVDLSMPVYDALKRSGKVEGLTLKRIFEYDGDGEYHICYEVAGKRYELKFVAKGASIFKPENGFGTAFYGGDRAALISEVGEYYGMTEKEIRALVQFVNSQEAFPNN